ncbi:MAG: hypothetical protein ACI9IO_002137, partial [Cyanobium sp.]
GGELSAYCPETGAVRSVPGLQQGQFGSFSQQLQSCLP